jgi:4-hydroxy-3-polyprenylbenzoate decarboxylase
VETHLIISSAAKRTLLLETDYAVEQVQALADQFYDFSDPATSLAFDAYTTIGMVIVPCAIKPLSGIAHSYNDNSILRAANMVIKDQLKLVLVLHETPLHLDHVRLMSRVIELGAILLPPIPNFYPHPKTIDDIISQTLHHVLDLFEIELTPVSLKPFPEAGFKS